MPIFGLYLIKNYLKVLLLAVFSFVAILLVSRLEEIAEFATLGAHPMVVVRFVLYQIPYILPIAIPISCLISAMLLFQRLSETHELTALRAGGFALKKIIAPLLFAGLIMGGANFYITSELATTSHLATRQMAYKLTSTNPLLLLQHAKIAQLRGSYVHVNPIRNGEAAKELVIALNQGAGEPLKLCLAEKIEVEGKELLAHNVSIISGLRSQQTPNDHLVIENQQLMRASASEFAGLLRKGGWKIAADHLKLRLLRLRIESYKEQIAQGGLDVAKLRKKLTKSHVEMIRRLSMGLAAFTFTLMGISFGMEISRQRSKRGLLSVIALGALALIAFFAAKELDHLLWVAAALFLLPNLLIVVASLKTLKAIQRGIE